MKRVCATRNVCQVFPTVCQSYTCLSQDQAETSILKVVAAVVATTHSLNQVSTKIGQKTLIMEKLSDLKNKTSTLIQEQLVQGLEEANRLLSHVKVLRPLEIVFSVAELQKLLSDVRSSQLNPTESARVDTDCPPDHPN